MSDLDLDRHPLTAHSSSSALGSGHDLRAATRLGSLDARQAIGGALIAAGIVAVGVAWFGISGTAQTWKQLPYLVSGGLGGAALIIIGVACFLSLEHARDREAVTNVARHLESLEARLGRIEQRLDGLDTPVLERLDGALDRAVHADTTARPARGRSRTNGGVHQ